MADLRALHDLTQNPWLDELLDYIHLTEEDRKALQRLSTVLLPALPGMIDEFHLYLRNFSVSHIFTSPSQEEQMKLGHLEYFKCILEGSFDTEYVLQRKSIGDSHVRLDLPPKWFIGSYAFFCEKIIPWIASVCPGGPENVLVTQTALLKIFFLDLQIVLESYIEQNANALVEARISLEKKLWMEDRLLTFILTEATDAIVGLDEQDRICTWSQGAQHLFGYKTNEVLNLSLADLACRKEIVFQIKQEAKEKGYANRHGADWRSKSGTLLEANATLTHLTDRHGNHVGSTLILQDLTEIRRLADKVKSMEQLTAMTKITASVAHEIRTPLGIIALTADLLQNRINQIADQSPGAIGEQEHQDINSMVADLQNEVERLNQIIDHYLMLSRIKNPNKTRTALKPFLHNVMEELSKRKTNYPVEWYVDTDEEIFVDIDTAQFLRLFRNLYENSLFAIQDTGKIILSAIATGDQVRIAFQDNGAGIPAKNLERIFAAFVTHRAGGTGLGLYLVREIVEAHQGTVEIESQPGEGTVILITLPIAKKPMESNAST